MIREIWLAPGEPLCRPASCSRMSTCARWLVQYSRGRSIDDFGRQGDALYVPAVCTSPKWAKWVDPATAIKPAAAGPASKDWIGR